MKRRIAKKVLEAGQTHWYTGKQINIAVRKLRGGRAYVVGVDKATGATPDKTVVVTGSFHNRTGTAPSAVLPGVLVVARDFDTTEIRVLDEVMESLTLPELKEAAKAKGLKGYSTLKKAELIALIQGAK